MFTLTSQEKVYVACPPQLISGGAELLHQLCYELNKKGFSAYMYYAGEKNCETSPVADRFLHYDNPYVLKIEDLKGNLLIVPETMIDYLKQFSNISKCVWWLGANHYLVPTELHSHKYLRVLGHYVLKIVGARKPVTFKELRKKRIDNLAQCWYVVNFLEKKGLRNVAYLSDYLAEHFINDYMKTGGIFSDKQRENIALYNPKRNTKYVMKIKKMAPDIRFVAIENMSPNEVMKLMQRAKVYVDFGSHPGKDRMPREAALQGCCILTSTLGSAAFFDDVPILNEFKYERTPQNREKIIAKIREIFKDYDKEVKKFDGYRKYILSEKGKFSEDIDKIFLLKKTKR